MLAFAGCRTPLPQLVDCTATAPSWSCGLHCAGAGSWRPRFSGHS